MTDGEMIRLVRESDVIDRTDGSELAKAFNYLFDKYIENPTTKNDLEVDAISREKAIAWAKFYADSYDAKTANESIMGMLRDLPPVTLIRPKGHWIWCGGSHKCSNCEEYTCFSHKVRYCPNCGSDNRGDSNGNE